MRTDDELARLQARTLYLLDDADLLLAVNDVGRAPAPVCHLAATAGRWHYWVRTELPVVERFCASTPPAPLTEPPAVLVQALFDGPPESFCGPAYWIPVGVRAASPYRIVACGPDPAGDFDGLPGWAGELAARQPAVAAFDGDRAVAICASARIGAEACEAGVETVPAYRGRGLAAAVTAAWAELVRDRGLLPLYSTSWDNVASQGVARRLGMIRYAATIALRPPASAGLPPG
jgi:hypothetical protein